MPRAPRLSFEVMETFVTLVECEGDASAAANRLGINQPSMSKRMAQLQQKHPDIRRSWVKRHGKKWLLTEEGQRVLPAIREIVRLSRQVQQDVASRIDESPDLSIACSQMAARTYVRDAWLKFRRDYPNARIRLSTVRGPQRIEGVETGLFDLAIVSHDESLTRDFSGHRLVTEHLLDDPWMLVCGSKVPAALGKSFDALPDTRVTLKHLRDLPLILPDSESETRHQIERAMMRAGNPVPLNIAMETAGSATTLQYVRDGLGVGLIGQAGLSGATGIRRPKAVDNKLIEAPRQKIIYRSGADSGQTVTGKLAESFRHYLHNACQNRAHGR